jgi:hypothetical protein
MHPFTIQRGNAEVRADKRHPRDMDQVISKLVEAVKVLPPDET